MNLENNWIIEIGYWVVYLFYAFCAEGGEDVEKRRSRHRRCSIRKGVLKNLANLTGKNCPGVSFFNKFAGGEHMQTAASENQTELSVLEYSSQRAIITIFKKFIFLDQLNLRV